ncbi:hypothetical protein COCSUDRAFT_55328 [Coccomyxa subellipsoidea C-169]|uniref:Uncharacterized protein n=1 Tax=Coccomyxa subellipsoidea (strain C-169) TaxID=574566 RepID=I0Z9J0_COCSC|nr:hypothetical protein COCSUDRAFT_55328 [Coccomyxa subellipsoidea C-169]EIE27309.1 hypothetical protein COCSUDRAFT_55328 [Coccomyxa subellipsoidea C-169]|eukprot:XP_005651853.1 hypothetical protein COCSUDRAFT_55328 [Coccomyxa subellipsoidea C-169]
MQSEEDEDDIDQLLAGVQEPVSSKPKLTRLKRARASDSVAEVPASKRCEVEGVAASPARLAASASRESSPAPSAFRRSDLGEANEVSPAAAKSASAERQQGSEGGAGDDYWDEEDELEDYVMRRDLGQIKDDNAEGSGSDSGSEESGHSGKGGGEDDADSDDGALDNKELAAETQRILRDAARSDRIGKGAAPQVQPLSGVLAKIMQRKEEAISRQGFCLIAYAAKTPEQRVQKHPKPAVSVSPWEEDDGDLLLVDSDDDKEANKAAAKRALAQEESQLFGLESQSLPDQTILAKSTTPAQAC